MALYSGRILVRRGDEINYDPEKLMPGEWALSTDKKIVRICVSPGETIRMATYDAFEEDMEKIEEILATCQSIQEAVIRINTEISQKADAVAEYTAQAKQYRDEAKQFRDEAEQFSPEGYSKLLQTATETKERVDDLGENLETVSSEVETNKSNLEKVSFKVDTVIEKADLRIKETASGESIHLTDSSDAKVVEFGLYGNAKQETTTGAQLLNYEEWKKVTIGNGTAVFENNGVTITATNNDAHTGLDRNIRIPVSESEKIIISWEESSNKNGAIYIFPNGETTGYVANNNAANKSLTYTVPNGVTFITFRFGVTYAGDTISYKNIMINKGSTPLPYEPYTGGQPSPNPGYDQDVEISGASGSVVVKSCGKNLWNPSSKSTNQNGAERRGIVVPSGTYTITNNSSETVYCRDGISSAVIDPISIKPQQYSTITFNIEGVFWHSNSGALEDIQVEKGEVATPYEPYKETSPTIPTPNRLAGINVDSGGNYTDSNGQMRSCDKIVKYADGSGEYIQRIAKKYLSEITDWYFPNWSNPYCFQSVNAISDIKPILGYTQKANMLCNRFICKTVNDIAQNIAKTGIGQYGQFLYVSIEGITTSSDLRQYFTDNETYIYYELAEPIRTPLTAEQIAEIEKLCTFYPATNIFNDADCGMKVTYIVDAKKYIDNKIAELATAMVNSI